jgi:hypothetical protein
LNGSISQISNVSKSSAQDHDKLKDAMMEMQNKYIKLLEHKSDAAYLSVGLVSDTLLLTLSEDN